MPDPNLHAWDCPCGTRNAPNFAACRNCRGPMSQGRPVFGKAPTGGAPGPVSRPPSAPASFPPAPPAPPPPQRPAPPPPAAPPVGYQPAGWQPPAYPQAGYPPAAYPPGGYTVPGNLAPDPDFYPRAEAVARRFAAFWIDIGLLLVVLVAGAAIAEARFPGGELLLLVALFGSNVAIGILGGRGQTPGQWVMYLQMMRLNGDPPGFWRAWFRQLLLGISTNCLFLGFLWMLWDRRQQAWHDMVTGVVVVRPQQRFASDQPAPANLLGRAIVVLVAAAGLACIPWMIQHSPSNDGSSSVWRESPADSPAAPGVR